MAIEVKCTVCGRTFSAMESAVDTTVRCPNCGEVRHVLAAPAAKAEAEQQAPKAKAEADERWNSWATLPKREVGKARPEPAREYLSILKHADDVYWGAKMIRAAGRVLVVLTIVAFPACMVISLKHEDVRFFVEAIMGTAIYIVIGILLIALSSFISMIADTCEMARSYVTGKQAH
jgi:predicted RNA-binding Zn-ribbon protein involved in translation (DUF1610 family)